MPSRAALGSGTPHPAMLANKVSEGQAAACPGHESALIAAPCLPPFPWRALGVGGVGGSLLASLLVWHLPRAGGYGWGGDELLVCPPPPPPNAISQHFASHWGRKLTFSLRRAPSMAQTHRHAAPGAVLLGGAGTQAWLSLSLGGGAGGERRSLHQGCVITKHLVLNHPVWE